MAGSVNIAGLVQAMAGGSLTLGPLTIVGNNTEVPVYTPILGTGDNTFAVPSGTTTVVFVPASGLAAVKYRTLFADVGIYLSPSNPSVISIDPSNTPSNIYLNVGTAASSNSELWFF